LKHPMELMREPVIRAEWPHFLCSAQVNRSREKTKEKMGMVSSFSSH
jgi:hypothetical protein